MRLRWLRGLPIFWQTLVLVLSAVVIGQIVGFFLFVVNPAPRPQFNRLSGVAAVLLDDLRDLSEHERPLITHMQRTPPQPRADMTSDGAVTRSLADRIGARESDVRLFFEPERISDGPFNRRAHDPVAVHHGETLFFSSIVAGVDTGHGWRVAESPLPPLVAPWQLRQLAWLAISAIALIPLAWGFARALAGPILRFAEAAERLGADPGASQLAEEGPAELRKTAQTLNAMKSRITGYVGERTEMIGAIAHDLRTPLARIAFRIEAAPEPLREKVIADVEQMRAMLAATIAFVRGMASGRERVVVDLTSLLGAIVDQDRDLGRPVAARGMAPARVSGDPLMLERLFQNLIDNGVIYGGQVEVSVANDTRSAVVAITDRGPGLAPDMLSRAFQPFVRGEPSRNRATGGIGLGLSIARTIVEEHGGSIILANRDGGGLEAKVSLPLAA